MTLAVRARMIVAEGKVQSPMERKIVLLSPALKVRNVSGRVYDLAAVGGAGFIEAKGRIKFNLFYLGTDLLVHYRSLSLSFCTEMEMPGAEPRLDVTAKATVANIEAELSEDCCMLNLKAILSLEAMATEEKIVHMGLGGEEKCLFPVIKQGLCVKKEIEHTSNLSRPARRAKVAGAQISITKSRVLTGKVALTGSLKEDLVMEGRDGGSKYQHREQLGLDLLIAVAGASPALKVQVEAEIVNIKTNLVAAGQRLRQKFTYILVLTLVEERALAPGRGASLVWARQIVGAGRSPELLQGQLLLPEGAGQVYQVDCSNVSVEGQALAERLLIHGSALIAASYSGEDGLKLEYRTRLPLLVCVPAPGAQKGMEAQIRVRLLTMVTHFDQASSLLDVKALFRFDYRLVQEAKIKVAAD